MSVLFPAEFLHALATLRISTKRVPAGGRHAEHLARQAGPGIEFRDHRAYVPGDDLRRVDWNLYLRFRKLFLRLADDVRDLPLYLVVDLSESSSFEDPPRSRAGMQSGLMLATIANAQHDPVSVFTFGEKLGPRLLNLSGRSAIPRLLPFLESQRSLGRTDFGSAFAEFTSLPLRRGLLVVISDFLDRDGCEGVVRALEGQRHRLLLLKLIRASDRAPLFAGDSRLVDSESGSALDLCITEEVLARYLEAVAAFDHGLRTFADQRGSGFVEVDSEKDVLPQLEPLFADGVYRA